MPTRVTRRRALQGMGLMAAGYWTAATPVRSLSANSAIRFACFGMAGKGASCAEGAAKAGDIVAICDVDDENLANAAKKYPKAHRFIDYRKLLNEDARSIDAVTICTPDHTHAVIACMAMSLGKHCFCEKPLAHNLFESRRMAEIAREKKLVTQLGIQGTANPPIREAAELVRKETFGKITEVHLWTNRPIWQQGMERPAAETAPAKLHWDEWLGPAPYRPYAKGYHPYVWRGFWDFGSGAMDMAGHEMNLPFMALDLRYPASVEATTSGHNKDSFPSWSVIRYEFPETAKRQAVKMTWYDGGKKPPEALLDGEKMTNNGILLIGDRGKLFSESEYGNTWVGLPKSKFPNLIRDPKAVAKVGHFEEFANAIPAGGTTVANFPDYGSPLSDLGLLGNLAIWAGKKIEWDAKSRSVKGQSELDEFIRPKYRSGHSIA